MIDKEKYKSLLGQMESGNDYSIINSIGAIGKYQFIESTLNPLQLKYNLPPWISPSYFASRPSLQEKYIDAYIDDTLNFINRNNLTQYTGRKVTGSIRFKTITASLNIYGILAMLHLGSPNAVLRFLQQNIDTDDGETSLSDYAALFSSSLSNFTNFSPLLLAIIPAIVLYYI